MVFTTYGRERIAIGLGSNISNNFISYFGVGSGSGAENVSNITLSNEYLRVAITGSPNFATSRKVTFTGDLNTIQSSGLNLTEFAFMPSGPPLTGSVFTRDLLSNSVLFDGTLEAVFTYTIEVM